jgi:hypothetical protein
MAECHGSGVSSGNTKGVSKAEKRPADGRRDATSRRLAGDATENERPSTHVELGSLKHAGGNSQTFII